MMERKQFAALIGFAFAAAWISFNFGYAVLCLVGAGVFYFAASYLEGEVDIADIQERFGQRGGHAGGPGPAPRPQGKPRVQ